MILLTFLFIQDKIMLIRQSYRNNQNLEFLDDMEQRIHIIILLLIAFFPFPFSFHKDYLLSFITTQDGLSKLSQHKKAYLLWSIKWYYRTQKFTLDIC